MVMVMSCEIFLTSRLSGTQRSIYRVSSRPLLGLYSKTLNENYYIFIKK